MNECLLPMHHYGFIVGHGIWYIGGCQNHGPVLVPSYTTPPNIKGTQKETIILTSTQYGSNFMVDSVLDVA